MASAVVAGEGEAQKPGLIPQSKRKPAEPADFYDFNVRPVPGEPTPISLSELLGNTKDLKKRIKASEKAVKKAEKAAEQAREKEGKVAGDD